MFMNKLLLTLLLISFFSFSQTKKKVDTIYVREKVVVYKKRLKNDTTLTKSSILDSIIVKNNSLPIKQAAMLPIADTTLVLKNLLKPLKKTPKKNHYFQIDKFGVSVQYLFSKQSEIQSIGGGIGIFTRKNIYNNKLFIHLELSFSKVFSSSESKSFDGYFITPNEVMYYIPQDIKTQQICLPINFYYKLGKIKPLLGFSYTKKQTEFNFFSYPNNTELTTIQEKKYDLKQDYLDLNYGLEYDLSKRIYIALKSKITLSRFNGDNPTNGLKSVEYLQFFSNQLTLGFYYNFITH